MKKQFQMLAALLIAFTIFSIQTNAQLLKASPFKPLPKPNKVSLISGAIAVTNPTITAFRFTPMAGYNITTQQLQAGIGYGIQWMHFVDSTQKYYTSFSINAVGWVNGSTTPSLDPPNFVSYGLTLGVLNQLVQFGAAYTPGTSGTNGGIGFIINFAVPLNN